MSISLMQKYLGLLLYIMEKESKNNPGEKEPDVVPETGVHGLQGNISIWRQH